MEVFRLYANCGVIDVNDSSDRVELLNLPLYDAVARLAFGFPGYIEFGDSSVVATEGSLAVLQGGGAPYYFAIPPGATHVAYFVPDNNGKLWVSTGTVR